MEEVSDRASWRRVGVLAAFMLLVLAAFPLLVRTLDPSPFAAGTGYGAGHGAMSPMFGASPRAGAAR